MKNIFIILFLNFCFVYSQEVDESLLEKYDIDFTIRGNIITNSFYIESCDFCDEFKIELFKAGLNISEKKIENQNTIQIDFNSLSKGLKVIRGWNGKVLNSDGKIISVFNVEKKKVVINPRQDYLDRKNCMLYIAKEIYSKIK